MIAEEVEVSGSRTMLPAVQVLCLLGDSWARSMRKLGQEMQRAGVWGGPRTDLEEVAAAMGEEEEGDAAVPWEALEQALTAEEAELQEILGMLPASGQVLPIFAKEGIRCEGRLWEEAHHVAWSLRLDGWPRVAMVLRKMELTASQRGEHMGRCQFRLPPVRL